MRAPRRTYGNPAHGRKGYKYEADRPEALPDPNEVARASLRYFRACRPGKRRAALGSLWQALFGQGRDAYPFNHAAALDSARRVSGGVRHAYRSELDAAITVEIDTYTRRAMVRMLRVACDLEALIVGRDA